MPNAITTVKKVFISHGHNETVKLKVRNFIKDRLHIEPVILVEQPDLGLTVVEKIEKYGKECDFALVLLTADDQTIGGEARARQNVIYELGFFHGFLGRDRVLLLKQSGVEPFSNISGLIYKEFDGDNIEAVFEHIRIALESCSAMRGREGNRPLRVLIAGSLRYDGSSLTAGLFKETCQEVGRQLAERGFHLVIGSWAPDTADMAVLDSFRKSGGRRVTIAGITEQPESWWRHMLGANVETTFLQVTGSWEPTGRSEQVRASDAAFIIGGARGAIELSKIYILTNPRIVSTPQLGLAAKSIWDKRVRERAMAVSPDCVRRLESGTPREVASAGIELLSLL